MWEECFANSWNCFYMDLILFRNYSTKFVAYFFLWGTKNSGHTYNGIVASPWFTRILAFSMDNLLALFLKYKFSIWIITLIYQLLIKWPRQFLNKIYNNPHTFMWYWHLTNVVKYRLSSNQEKGALPKWGKYSSLVYTEK